MFSSQAGLTVSPTALFDMTISLMLVTLGISLARMKVVRIGRAAAIALP